MSEGHFCLLGTALPLVVTGRAYWGWTDQSTLHNTVYNALLSKKNNRGFITLLEELLVMGEGSKATALMREERAEET